MTLTLIPTLKIPSSGNTKIYKNRQMWENQTGPGIIAMYRYFKSLRR